MSSSVEVMRNTYIYHKFKYHYKQMSDYLSGSVEIYRTRLTLLVKTIYNAN